MQTLFSPLLATFYNSYYSVVIFLITFAIISYKQKKNYQINNYIKQQHKVACISNSETKCKSMDDITNLALHYLCHVCPG